MNPTIYFPEEKLGEFKMRALPCQTNASQHDIKLLNMWSTDFYEILHYVRICIIPTPLLTA